MMRWRVMAFAAVALAACKTSPPYGVTTTTGGAVEAGLVPPVPASESAVRSAAPATSAPRPAEMGPGPSGDESIDRARSGVGTRVQPPLAPPGEVEGPPLRGGPRATPAVNGPPATDEGSRSTGSSSDDDGGVIPFWGTSF
jgi:hypothetical protein